MAGTTGMSRRQLLRAAGAAAAGAVLPGAFAGRVSAAEEVITLAIAAPMTGDSASMGLNAQRGADAAVAMINAAGGIAGKKVAYDIFDDQGSPREAASVARRILDADKYAAVVGHVNSSCTLAAMPVYSEAGIAVLCGSSSNPKVTESGWDNIIRMTIRDDYGAQQYSAFAANNLGRKKLGILFANDDYGRGLRDEMVKAAKALAADIAAEAGFTPNADKDFSSVISDFKAKSVDAFMLNCNYTEGGLFLGQAKGVGVAGIPAVGPDSLLYDEFISLAQGGAEGAYILAAYDPYSQAPKPKAFMDAFQKAYSALPSQVAVFTNDFFLLAKQLMEAGATPQTLVKAAKDAKFDGAGGHYEWDAKGDVKGRTFAVVQVKDGKFVSTGKSVDEKGLEKLRG
ncbi:ABC transporter substrate-binding protein [Labrys monachus]|uniref:Branched-chain amino acid transport system substrate-binding protein n=1 Tax=Labrys monachus TaxID=217067 RepID=A0ABU0F8M5_9HYPH|nr:ABC transporter substrate-binding protein [Labrys monachus]MDQ0390494.1 branched-chain amino acid transport system substrate-binding protein [Labrys monachus]